MSSSTSSSFCILKSISIPIIAVVFCLQMVRSAPTTRSPLVLFQLKYVENVFPNFQTTTTSDDDMSTTTVEAIGDSSSSNTGLEIYDKDSTAVREKRSCGCCCCQRGCIPICIKTCCCGGE
jgi:hypothetical protein